MKLIYHVHKYAGILGIPTYIFFTFMAHLHNKEINPMNYWLSDYGNPFVNPDGSVFYNTGCVITALLLAVFYIGMYCWYGRDRASRKLNISYAIAQSAGLFGSFFLIMTTVYPLGVDNRMHAVFSTANMIAMDFFISFTATGFILNPKISKGIGVFGFFTAVFNIITMNIFADFYISEWIFFLLFMVYMVLVTFQYDKLCANRLNNSMHMPCQQHKNG